MILSEMKRCQFSKWFEDNCHVRISQVKGKYTAKLSMTDLFKCIRNEGNVRLTAYGYVKCGLTAAVS